MVRDILYLKIALRKFTVVVATKNGSGRFPAPISFIDFEKSSIRFKPISTYSHPATLTDSCS